MSHHSVEYLHKPFKVTSRACKLPEYYTLQATWESHVVSHIS